MNEINMLHTTGLVMIAIGLAMLGFALYEYLLGGVREIITFRFGSGLQEEKRRLERENKSAPETTGELANRIKAKVNGSDNTQLLLKMDGADEDRPPTTVLRKSEERKPYQFTVIKKQLLCSREDL